MRVCPRSHACKINLTLMDGTSQARIHFEENQATYFAALFATLQPAQDLHNDFIAAPLAPASDANVLRDQAARLIDLLQQLSTAMMRSECMAYYSAFSGLKSWKKLSGKLQTALWRLVFTVPKLNSAVELRHLLGRRKPLVNRLLHHVGATFRSVRAAYREAAAAGVADLPPLPDTPAFAEAMGYGTDRGSSSGSSDGASMLAELSRLSALVSAARRNRRT